MSNTIWAIGICLSFLGCMSSKSTLSGKYIQGYKFNPLPSSSVTNGYVYAKKKGSDEVLYLTSIDLPGKEGLVAIPSDEKLIKAKFSTLIQWLGAKIPNLSADGNFNINREITMHIEFRDAKLVEVPISDAADKIKLANSKIAVSIKGLLDPEDYNYYIIVATISAKKMDYYFDKKTYDSINLKAGIDSLIKVTPEVGVTKGNLTKLQFDDSTYRNVLYKPLQLGVGRSLSGEYEIRILQ